MWIGFQVISHSHDSSEVNVSATSRFYIYNIDSGVRWCVCGRCRTLIYSFFSNNIRTFVLPVLVGNSILLISPHTLGNWPQLRRWIRCFFVCVCHKCLADPSYTHNLHRSFAFCPEHLMYSNQSVIRPPCLHNDKDAGRARVCARYRRQEKGSRFGHH